MEYSYLPSVISLGECKKKKKKDKRINAKVGGSVS